MATKITMTTVSRRLEWSYWTSVSCCVSFHIQY